MTTQIGVFPVHKNIFKINKLGRTGSGGDRVVVKDLETFAPAIDAVNEEWTPMDTEGWIRRAITGKGLTFSFTGKRQYGDPGNDYIAGLILSVGQDVESELEWTLPNGSVLLMNCVINLTAPAGGDSTNIDSLEFEVQSDGKPSFTSNAALPLLTFVCTDHATAGATQVASVSPVLGGGNSYLYKVNGSLPVVGADLTGLGWASYTLTAAIPVVNGNTIALVEVSTGDVAVKGGTAVAVVA